MTEFKKWLWLKEGQNKEEDRLKQSERQRKVEEEEKDEVAGQSSTCTSAQNGPMGRPPSLLI